LSEGTIARPQAVTGPRPRNRFAAELMRLRSSRLHRRRTLTAYLFMLPSLGILAVFMFWPMYKALRISLTDFNVFQSHWVGLDNYRHLIHDPSFHNALQNTLVYSAITTPLSVALALAFALLLNRKMAGRDFFRATIFLPVITSLAIAAIAWRFLINPDIGLVPYWLEKLGLTTKGLADPTWAMIWVIVVGVWKNVGFYTVMYLAGLQSIPRELYEAAAVDGAKAWTRFRTMTWPLLMNTTMFVFVIAVIAALQTFDQIFVMTHGGPFFKTETLVMMIYRLGFNEFKMGYAAAISWVLVLMVFALSMIQIKFFNKRMVRY
jgi:multiple sugar transport system permease protein